MTALAVDSMQGLSYRPTVVPTATLSRGIPCYRQSCAVRDVAKTYP